MPKVSVIVPIYKVEKYLIQCVDSIVNQTLKDIEIILVDEGDLDACRAICDMYEFGSKKDSRIKTIHEKNGGYGASVNKGFDIATGEYISIIESDDFIEPTMFEEMYDYAKSLDADVVKTPYYEYWDPTETQPEKRKICFWYDKVKNVPENVTFKIEDYPEFVAIHPSIWAALYKADYLKSKNIKCLEAKGAGYIDNHFRLQTLCQTDKIAWLNRALNYYRLSNPDASQANYNLATFIQRWSNVHSLFTEKFSSKWETLAPYCIQEEWINTYYRVFYEHYSLTEDSCNQLIENLMNITSEQIHLSALKKYEKNKLLSFKKNPEKLKKYVKSRNICSRIYILGLPLLEVKEVRQNTLFVYAFRFFPLFKLKKRSENLIKIYLFGLLPLIIYEK